MIETGTILQQRYKIDKQIGQGGMGAVYVASDERFGSTVAIKETLCMDENFRIAIEREARLLNSLKHSALPRVSDHFEESESLFLVMEYIPGEDVAAMLEIDHATFTVEQVMSWADQLLDALDYLHNQDTPVIHRDIKPQNLKINSRGEMILLDFGLAKGNPTDASHQTAAKSIFGYSRNYASLEQIQGTGTDPRSDLYSLAATLYHMLANVPPTDALTRAMSVLSKKPDPLEPASSVNPTIPKGVAGVLQKALDLDANERPASALEMRQMLHDSENYAYLADQVTIAGQLTDPRVFSQQTKLMPERMQTVSGKTTNAGIEVSSGPLSQVTAMRSSDAEFGADSLASGAKAVPESKGRGMGMAAGAFLMLLFGVAVAGGLYVVNPSIFGDKTGEANSADPMSALPEIPKSDTNSLGDASQMEIGNSNDNGGHTATEISKPAPKPIEAAKGAKPTVSSKSNAEKDLGEIVDIQVNDPDIPPGGILMTERDENGKLKTMRINRVGPPPPGKRPMPPRGDSFPRGFRFEDLTPEQRRKVQRILNENPKIIVTETPKPLL